MPLDPIALGKTLADLGWAVAFVVLAVLDVYALVKGWVVPRFVHDREVMRADTLAGQLQRNTEALESLTDEVRWDARGSLRPRGTPDG